MQFTGPGSVLRLPANRLGSFPPVSLTAHWTMKAGLYSPLQSTPLTIKEEPLIFPSHRPHTASPSFDPSQTLNPFLFPSLPSQFVSVSAKNASTQQKRTNKTSRFSSCGDKLNLTPSWFLFLLTKLQLNVVSILTRQFKISPTA